MNAEIIFVSSELLRGQRVNKNAQFLTRQLITLGIPVYQSRVVGNFKDQLKEAVKEARKRSDILFIVGGLGPNDDDITKETISEYLDIPLVLDRETQDQMITYHKNADFTMPENNQKQALVLQDSTPLKNVTGLAAGMFYQKGDQSYFLLPRPMDEMEPLFEENVRPLIIEKLLKNISVETQKVRLFGTNLAQARAKLKDMIQYQESPFVSIYPDGDEIEIQITARAKTEKEAIQTVEKVKNTVEKRLGDFVYGYGNDLLPDVMKRLLRENNMTITAAESLTGGELLSTFSSKLEASKIFSGGIVTYHTEIKQSVLNVSKNTIDTFGVVSSQCAIEMAEKSRVMFGADIAVSLTGVAGPYSLEGEIPGTVWIGIAQKGETSFAKLYHFAYKRNTNRRLSVLSAINLVRLILENKPIYDKIFMDDEPHGDETKREQE